MVLKHTYTLKQRTHADSVCMYVDSVCMYVQAQAKTCVPLMLELCWKGKKHDKTRGFETYMDLQEAMPFDDFR